MNIILMHKGHNTSVRSSKSWLAFGFLPAAEETQAFPLKIKKNVF